MNSQIEYLNRLEADLEVLAEDVEAKRTGRGGGRGGGQGSGQGSGGRWKMWTGAAAAVLVLAWSVGFLAEGGGFGGGDGALEPPRGGFYTVGPDGTTTGPGEVTAGELDAAAWTAPAATPQAPAETTGTKAPAVDLSKIVRDGSFSLRIPNGSFDERFQEVADIAGRHGGFVLASQSRGPGYGSLTLRIPASRFDDAVSAVRQLGVVTESQITGEDVTAEYIDLEARLTILEGRRDILLGLMAEADTIQETITIDNALNEVQFKIEQIQGQIRFLDNQVAVSTLKVELREESVEEPVAVQENDIANPSLSRAFDRAARGFFGVLATVIVGLGYLVPTGALAAIGYAAFTLARRRSRLAT